jgi:hypothetical protein
VNELLGSIEPYQDNVLWPAQRIKLDDVDHRARFKRAKELVISYLRRENRVVALIDDLLAKAGETIDGLMLSHLKGQLDNIKRFDRFISIAEARRNASLREIDRRRSALGEKARRCLEQIEERELTLIEVATGKGKDAA